MSDDTTSTTEHHVDGANNGLNGHHGRIRRPRLLGWFLMMVTAIVVVAVGFVGVVLGHSKGGVRSTITVTGSGTVQGTPDTINFQIGVNTVNPTATAALAQNNQKVAALERALERNGVTKKEMQTSGLNIYENTNNQGTITGFTVSDQLSVTMHQVQKAGAAIDAAAKVAGNGVQLDGVSFTITNDSKLLQAARVRAVDNARTAAGQLSKAGGAHVTGIVKITDQENQSSGVYYPSAYATASALKDAVPLQTGSQPVNVQVTVVYSLAG
ncbi:MAG TPA: SIMPL domain-containing protein [Acidimicrobiales bacterium]